jgi:branched-chain amino acid transport system permease protein
MTDTAKPDAAAAARPVPAPRIPADALKNAGIAFLVALALFGSLIGFKTETVNGALEISTRFGMAFIYSAIVAGVRLLADLLIWRRLADGQSLASLFPAAKPVLRTAAGFGLALGLVLFFAPGLRTNLIAWVAQEYWLLGTLTGLATFTCMAGFVVAAAMALVRLARVVLAILRKDIGGISERLVSKFSEEFPVALLAVAIALPFLITGQPQRYAIDTATQILIYVMLGWGLNVVVGLAGLLDLGYVAFYAVGAYTYALIATQFGWSFWACLPLAGLFAALWGITLGFPVLRLRGDYLAIVTLAFGEIIRIVILNWQSLTGGPNGINRIPKLTFFGLPFDKVAQPSFHGVFGLAYDPVYRIIFLYYVILFLALVTNYVTLRLRRLPIGRAWEALREDEIACRSAGINTVITKLTAFAIGAMFAGFAGAFFSARQGFISPESFTFMESALVLAIVVLGGLGSQLGVVIAAVVLVGSQERFRELQDYRMLIFGLSMVLVMIWRPRGLMSGRTPSAYLHQARAISSSFVKEGRG